MSMVNMCGTLFSPEKHLSNEDESVDMHTYYTVNMAFVNYIGTQLTEIMAK